MYRMLAAVAALSVAGAVNAQVRAYEANGVLQPFPDTYGATLFFEVLGHGVSGPNTEYFSIEPLPGDVGAAAAEHSRAIGVQALGAYTSATARFAYDQSMAPLWVVAPGTAYYPGTSLEIELAGVAGSSAVLNPTSSEIAARDRTSIRWFAQRAQGDGYPPAPLPNGKSLAYGPVSSEEFRLDFRALMASATCCSDLYTQAPGALPVVLTSPSSYAPVYMGLSLSASRDRSLPPVDGLPAVLDLASFDLERQVYVSFGGHFGLVVDAVDYASHDDYLAASSWIDANIGVVNFEITAQYEITSLQAVPVPEPATWALWAAGALLLSVSVLARKRQIRNA